MACIWAGEGFSAPPPPGRVRCKHKNLGIVFSFDSSSGLLDRHPMTRGRRRFGQSKHPFVGRGGTLQVSEILAV
jgi:hypothetical protein